MRYLAAHGARAVVLLCLGSAVFAALGARIAIPVDLATFQPPRDIPLIELLATACGGVAAGLTAPRMVEWEKLGTRRVAWWAALVVPAVAALALLVVAAGVAVVAADAPWHYMPANVVVLTSAGVLARVLLGPVTAPVLTVVVFLACCVVQNTVPDVGAWLPLSRPNGAPLPIAVPLVALAVATATAARTRGMTTWAHALGRD
ncbi:hypothetical protein [Saccharothrix obliqua]|uniref:hypothetical protein n=1 Tax=Saccharothrix obliqua TaxID=2861747 RepID=UPI001C5DA531|nr:hypothetical protein [Saccharothrix obliqua]MBW4717116.1 hypothetical protein [Saccharothrix obliqua]